MSEQGDRCREGRSVGDEVIRTTALHEAISFLMLRRDAMPRLADVADVTSRMEHYLRTGSMPLDAAWSSGADETPAGVS